MFNQHTDHLEQAPKPAHHFEEEQVLRHLKHYLPTQTPLKDFIHHNSLHAFQHMRFFDAIYLAADVFGFQVTLQLSEFRKLYRIGRIREDILEKRVVERYGHAAMPTWKDRLLTQDYDCNREALIGSLRSQWKTRYKLDMDNQVQPILFRILASYLDQGIALWKFPRSEGGFLASIRQLEKNSIGSFFSTALPRELLMNDHCGVRQLLKMLVGREAYFEQYLFDQQFSHRGWSGMVAAVEHSNESLLDRRKITLSELISFELLLEIDTLCVQFGNDWQPLCDHITTPPLKMFSDKQPTELEAVLTLWQEAFEWSYYDEVLSGIRQSRLAIENDKKENDLKKSFQALFCIDERECSLRRHIEMEDPACETMGTPGFFGVEFYFRAEHAQYNDKLCPAPVTPKFLIKESGSKQQRGHEPLYSPLSQTLAGGMLSTMSLGYFAAFRLIRQLFSPSKSPAISNAFSHMQPDSVLTIENNDESEREDDLQLGFTVAEMASRVEALLRGIGLVENFAPIVYLVAHGSSSANNPHHGAHDCGACSGRPGSVNARVMSFMANHPGVREILQVNGINIPVNTQFLGGLHDTAADQLAFYDVDTLSNANRALHILNMQAFERALDQNAKERSRRFSSIDTTQSLQRVRKAIRQRSVSMFEPRPELGHGTNTLCIVGSRQLTKNLFLDRRAFLNSYDYRTDPEGKLLTGIMRPLGPVCGGINLEYYFSRVDNFRLGAGTKLPHNVMGLIGVANSSDGDLRPGLPLQMIEVHDPMRLLIIVEHAPTVVLNSIRSTPEMYEWYLNEWVQLVVLDPATNDFFRFRNGAFEPYTVLTDTISTVDNFTNMVESAREMETNNIVDATRENLPVYSIK